MPLTINKSKVGNLVTSIATGFPVVMESGGF